jgi:hypothetical protein
MEQEFYEVRNWIFSEYKPLVLPFREPATAAGYAEASIHNFC